MTRSRLFHSGLPPNSKVNFMTAPTRFVEGLTPNGTPNNSSLRLASRQTYDGVRDTRASLPLLVRLLLKDISPTAHPRPTRTDKPLFENIELPETSCVGSSRRCFATNSIPVVENNWYLPCRSSREISMEGETVYAPSPSPRRGLPVGKPTSNATARCANSEPTSSHV